MGLGQARDALGGWVRVEQRATPAIDLDVDEARGEQAAVEPAAGDVAVEFRFLDDGGDARVLDQDGNACSMVSPSNTRDPVRAKRIRLSRLLRGDRGVKYPETGHDQVSDRPLARRAIMMAPSTASAAGATSAAFTSASR